MLYRIAQVLAVLFFALVGTVAGLILTVVVIDGFFSPAGDDAGDVSRIWSYARVTAALGAILAGWLGFRFVRWAEKRDLAKSA